MYNRAQYLLPDLATAYIDMQSHAHMHCNIMACDCTSIPIARWVNEAIVIKNPGTYWRYISHWKEINEAYIYYESFKRFAMAVLLVRAGNAKCLLWWAMCLYKAEFRVKLNGKVDWH